ncbi:MAG: hypothetical protein IKZ87_04390 [Actinomycetaceae bacterium]|nr:hypothetical protein [Actinomycetaceae bacterium]
MENPDFTGLHGKELIKKHTKWRREQIKAGALKKSIQYTGLTREQAIEVFQQNRRMQGFSQLATALCVTVGAIFGARAGYNTAATSAVEIDPPAHTLPFIALVLITWYTILLGWAFYAFFSVRNMEAARKAYIYSEDERVNETKKKSGLTPITIASLIEMYASVILEVLSILLLINGNASASASFSGAAIALFTVAILQTLISLIVYFVLSKRN